MNLLDHILKNLIGTRRFGDRRPKSWSAGRNKYLPHQGKAERARRRKQMEKINGNGEA